ncbi:hypothetical protein ACLVWQ_18960 [Streptomyces sp. CWNU-52B]|uniref:hypothetical protein n=1 Tax=unclassified Streptomyces TaxID=2593676 RepID=UPI0039C26E0A
MMRNRISRPVVALWVAAALGCTAACGGGGGGSAPDGKVSRSTASERTAGGSGAKGTPTGGADQDTRESQGAQGGQDGRDTPGARGTNGTNGPLSKAQLKKAALVTADVKGFAVEESQGADLLGQSVPAAPSKCQAVADMFLFTTDPSSKAGVSRGVVAKDETDSAVNTFALLSYASGEADKVIDGLRKATKNCTAYRHADYDYRDVKALDAPDLGGSADEAVAFRLLASIEGAEVPAAFTVVRDGTTLVAFSSMNLLDADRIEVPEKLVEAQLTKLAKTTG